MKWVTRSAACLFLCFALAIHGCGGGYEIQDPITFDRACDILTDATHVRCPGDIFPDCHALVPTEPCCSNCERGHVRDCAERIRAAKDCIDALNVTCGEIYCVVWAE